MMDAIITLVVGILIIGAFWWLMLTSFGVGSGYKRDAEFYAWLNRNEDEEK